MNPPFFFGAAVGLALSELTAWARGKSHARAWRAKVTPPIEAAPVPGETDAEARAFMAGMLEDLRAAVENERSRRMACPCDACAAWREAQEKRDRVSRN